LAIFLFHGLWGIVKLILMPGMDGTGELFAPLLRVLGDSIESTVLRYPTDEPLGYADLLPCVRAALPSTGPFVLLGESFSGPLAIMAAAEAPAGLCGVILCASFATNPIPWFPRFARPFVRPLLFRGKPHFPQIKALLGRYETPELRALLLKADSAVSPAVMAARARDILAVDVMAQFKACPYPMLYLGGQRDRVVRKRVVKRLLLEKPSLQVVTLPAPHLVLQVAPEEAAQAIHAFVRKVGTS
jgi:pimeloyl-ACP methyl ester carboxylesterase